MALVNGGVPALYKHRDIFVNSSLKATKKNGYGLMNKFCNEERNE